MIHFKRKTSNVIVISNYYFFPPCRSKDFWKRGLRQVWGNPDRVTDSDALRFQWPSVGKGWEDGLLKFTKAQTQYLRSNNDTSLLEKVLHPDTNAYITVVVGSHDKVVSLNTVRRYLQPFQSQVRVVEMQGMGHDPFEEDVDGFVKTLLQVLSEEKERILG